MQFYTVNDEWSAPFTRKTASFDRSSLLFCFATAGVVELVHNSPGSLAKWPIWFVILARDSQLMLCGLTVLYSVPLSIFFSAAFKPPYTSGVFSILSV